MAMILLAALAGYTAGTVLALFLDRLYTGAPLGAPLRLCGDAPAPPLLWTGAIGYLLARGRCPEGTATQPPAPPTPADEPSTDEADASVLLIDEEDVAVTPPIGASDGRLPARLWYLPVIGAVAGTAIAARAVDGRHAALVGIFSLFLLALLGTDIERHLLPNRLMYPALALALALSWAWPDESVRRSLMGGGLGLGLGVALFLLPFLILRRYGFGLGDVKLSALLGLTCGSAYALSAFAIGLIAGGAGAIVLLAARRTGRGAFTAYGPYLMLGMFLGMLARRGG